MSQVHTNYLGSYDRDYIDLAVDFREELAVGITAEMALPSIIKYIYIRHLGNQESIPWLAVGQNIQPRATVGRVAQVFVRQHWTKYEKR